MYLFRRFLTRFLKTGTLTIIEPGGSQWDYGNGEPFVTLRVHDRGWPLRVLRRPELAVGEGYMDGAFSVEQGTLEDFLAICMINKGWGRDHWIPSLASLAERFGRRLYQLNPLPRARRNVAHHYELASEFFDTFLDERRQYSCAYFATGNEDLEAAQEAKLRHIAAKLCMQPGMTVLDIGCGWGGLALYLARHCGARVTGITLSREQLEFAREMTRRAGLEAQVTFHLQDYRQVDEEFDRVVSVGMFEHVGTNHYPRFFRQLRRCLKPDGIALVHAIGRADGPGVTNAWIRKYIFPGGYSPALSEVLPVVERARVFVTDIEVLRLHYARTTRLWLQRFRHRREDIARMYDERFCRMWEFYLASAQMAFCCGGLMVFQLQLARNNDAAPITRDYIRDAEATLRATPANLPLSVAALRRTTEPG